MNFTPKTEKEIEEANLLPPGTYDFEVVDAADKTSKAGNEMIELNLRVFDADGGHRFVRDYLLESIPHKLRHVAYACGLGESYEAGSLAAHDFLDRAGRVKLVIKKDKTGQYSDQNSVKDYVLPEDATHPYQRPPATQAAEIDDEIPF